jgi:small-conductance mechanosensitive channel
MALNDSFKAIDAIADKKRKDLDRLMNLRVQAQQRVRNLDDQIEALRASLSEIEDGKRDLGVAMEWQAEKARREPPEHPTGPPETPPKGPPGGGRVIVNGKPGF